MFYLKHFFLNLKKQKVLGGFFFLSTIIYLFICLTVESRSLNKYFFSKNNSGSPYFNIVLDQSLHKKFILLKDKHVPGIQKITRIEKKKLNNLSTLQKQAQLDLNIYKIKLVKNIEDETIFLIKNYIKKYLQLDFLSASKVIWPQKINSSITSTKIFIIKGIMTFLWFLFFWVILTKSYDVFFIVENFSRKKDAFLKSFSLGLGICLSIALAINFLTINNLSLINILIVGIVMLVSFLLMKKFPELNR